MQVQKKRGRPNSRDRQLNEELIIYVAKTLMREQGKVPSIRALARALDVDAMAIYHYFDNKNSLLKAIISSLMGSIYFPKRDQDWQTSLQLICESYLALLNNYSGLLETLINMPSDGPISVFYERFNKVISPLNFPTQKQQQAFLLLLNFLHGQALLSKDSESYNEDDLKGALALYFGALEVI